MAWLRCKNNPSPRGFTLTEAAIVLGIVGLVLGGIWTAARGVYDNLKAKEGTELLITLVQNIRAAYASVPSFSSATNTNITNTLKNKGVFPPRYLNAAGGLSTPWLVTNINANFINVIVDPTTGGNNSRFLVRFTFSPDITDVAARRLCSAFLLANLNSGATMVQAANGYFNISNVLAGNGTVTADNIQCVAQGSVFAGFIFDLK